MDLESLSSKNKTGQDQIAAMEIGHVKSAQVVFIDTRDAFSISELNRGSLSIYPKPASHAGSTAPTPVCQLVELEEVFVLICVGDIRRERQASIYSDIGAIQDLCENPLIHIHSFHRYGSQRGTRSGNMLVLIDQLQEISTWLYHPKSPAPAVIVVMCDNLDRALFTISALTELSLDDFDEYCRVFGVDSSSTCVPTQHLRSVLKKINLCGLHSSAIERFKSSLAETLV